MMLDNILSRLQGVKAEGGGFAALCPAHEDNKASLSITQKDGKVLMHCHAGCTTEAVLSSIDLTLKNLFPTLSTSWESRVDKTYPYHNANGKLVYQVVRLKDPKDFRQRQPNGNNGWIWNMKGIDRVLYRLPDVLKAVKEGKPIFIPEGEKDCDTLTNLDLEATTNPGGASQPWLKLYTNALTGAQLILLPDNDDAGRKRVQTIVRAVGRACRMKIVELPGLPPKGDVSDWIAAGHTREDLIKIADDTPELEIKAFESLDFSQSASVENTSQVIGSITFPLTDMGNAERLIHHFGKDLRFICDRKRWIVWDGIRWTEDNTLQVERLAKETVRSIYREAEAVQDSQERKAIAKWALQSESQERIAAMIRLAQSATSITTDKLDTDPYLLCCKNGVIDLREGELLEPCRENYITKQIPVDYDQQAECPTLNRFLERVLPDQSVRRYIQKAIGYTLSGDVSEQCLFFLYGEGKNGKTTLVEIISELMGQYFVKARSDILMIRRNAGIPNEVASLAGSRLVSVSEVSSGQKLDEGLVKDLTGGDTLAARFLYGESFNFKAGFKLWLYGNHKPTIRGKDEGIWRRIRLLPFIVQIPGSERDGHLLDKLRLELPGVLSWALEGFLLWQKEGLHEPGAVSDAVNEYRREQDSLADFIAENCIIERQAIVTKKDFWNAYRQYAESTGEDCYESQRLFNVEIRTRPGIKEGHGSGNVAIWKGIALRDQA